MKPGPTGEYPKGKLNDDDEGELAIRIGTDQGNVILDFGGTKVSWLGFPPDNAHDFADKIKATADEIIAQRNMV